MDEVIMAVKTDNQTLEGVETQAFARSLEETGPDKSALNEKRDSSQAEIAGKGA